MTDIKWFGLTCKPLPWSQPDKAYRFGDKKKCVCGRVYVVRHGDGILTPPRPYWKQLRRLHFKKYRKHFLD